MSGRGHTQCDAVNAIIAEVKGRGHKLERNIPPPAAPIVPAVKRAQAAHPDKHGNDLGPLAVRENVWQTRGSLFMVSPALRNLARENKAKVVSAIYEMESDKVDCLPEHRVGKILAKVAQSPNKTTDPHVRQGQEFRPIALSAMVGLGAAAPGPRRLQRPRPHLLLPGSPTPRARRLSRPLTSPAEVTLLTFPLFLSPSYPTPYAAAPTIAGRTLAW